MEYEKNNQFLLTYLFQSVKFDFKVLLQEYILNQFLIKVYNYE